tara:strand:+ start:60 stop:956 length:897 start_codon:yes stop_codon:yes gene_type:complete
MIKTFFNNARIFDGGTGQELINRGLQPYKNLWSATALLDVKYHKTIVDIHVDFIKSGAEIILTNTFGSRKRRLFENNLLDKFKDLNVTAAKLAQNAVKKSNKKVLIAGSIPPQNFTYQSDLGNDLNFIKNSFYEQASYLDPFVDFFYLEVMCSKKECELAMEALKPLNKNVIVGLHLKNKGLLPSGEKFIDVAKYLSKFNLLGITTSCVNPEQYDFIKKDISKLSIPYGFKFNAFEQIPEGWKPDGKNTSLLGRRKDITPEEFLKICDRYAMQGAKLIGGCCQITPNHILELKKISRA